MAAASENNRPLTHQSCHEEVFNAETAGSRLVKIHDLPLTVSGIFMHITRVVGGRGLGVTCGSLDYIEKVHI